MLPIQNKYKPFLFVSFISCLLSSYSYASMADVDIYGPLVDKIKTSFIQDMRKNDNMICDVNGGSMIDSVQEISLGFYGFKELTIEETRSLVLKWSKDLILKVNDCKEIRPFLKNYHFDNQNISLMINFETIVNQKKRPVNPPLIAFAMLADGKIQYSLYDEENSYLSHVQEKKVLIETYEEALKIESEK